MFDQTTGSLLFQPLTLPNGQTIQNRIAKAAMEENMADARHLPGAALRGLYRQWGDGGVGMILTGNVMVAADAVTGPGGVVLDAGQPLDPFREWAKAGKAYGLGRRLCFFHCSFPCNACFLRGSTRAGGGGFEPTQRILIASGGFRRHVQCRATGIILAA